MGTVILLNGHKLALAFTLLAFASAPQADQQLSSNAQQATLVELYTSEGCSSCPPADRWYSTLADHDGLWRTVVPIAFHVDYWNYLGWEDRFARSAWSQRQRLHREQGNAGGVYTPAVMAAGREWRDWRYRGRQLPLAETKPGVLTVTIGQEDFTAHFSPAGQSGQEASVFNLALLGMEMQTRVRAGENRGKVLGHDFVVLDHLSYKSGELRWRGRLPSSPEAEHAGALAWAAWVNRPGNLAAVQATGGWVSRE